MCLIHYDKSVIHHYIYSYNIMKYITICYTYTYITRHVGQNNSPRHSATGSTNMQSTFTFTVKPFYKRDKRTALGEDPANYTAAPQQVFGPAGLNDTEWNLFLLAV